VKTLSVCVEHDTAITERYVYNVPGSGFIATDDFFKTVHVDSPKRGRQELNPQLDGIPFYGLSRFAWIKLWPHDAKDLNCAFAPQSGS
jgi:hypothetical protein